MNTDWRAYDSPGLLDTVSSRVDAAGTEREARLTLDALHCASCVARVRKLLAADTRELRVNLATKTVDFHFDPAHARLSDIAERLEVAGFAPQILAQDSAWRGERKRQRATLARIGVAAICAMQVMMLAWPTYFDAAELDAGTLALLRWSQWLLATPAVFYSGWPFFEGAWRSLRQRSLGMDVPVAISILVAYGASAARTLSGEGELYFDAATMFVLLLGAGRYVEGHTRARATERLRLIVGRRPLTATRLTDDGPRSVAIDALQPGDRISVAPGETVPVDGELAGDDAQLDESLLSGEARPVLRTRGAALLGGSLNAGHASLELRATGVGAQTRLAQIARLLSGAQATRPRLQQLADRIASHFIAVVLLLAVAGFAWWWPDDPARAMNVLLCVLVASCPCALSLAVPLVHASASSRLAAAGTMVAQPGALATLAHADTLLIDKTGTLTRPSLDIVRMNRLGSASLDECRAIAGALEHGLTHPVARAFQSRGQAPAEAVRLDAAGGVDGIVAGHRCWMGPANSTQADTEGLAAILTAADSAAFTWILLRRDAAPLALFGLAAHARPEACAVIAALQQRGLSVEILSGDGAPAVAALAQRVGIERYRARQSPEDKLARLRELQRSGRRVIAVGDGINDAPFLGAADVSVAMPSGAALAQAHADAILTGDSLEGLVALVDVARAARRRMRENLAWAFGYNLAVMPLALIGMLAPWVAALGMSISSLLVAANALRLARPAREAPPPLASTVARAA